MRIGKTLSFGITALLVACALFVVGQNANLSPPKSLGYQSGAVAGFEFSSGRYSANSFITVNLANGKQAKVPVDASFSAPQVGQAVCIHSSTEWLTNTLAYRFARDSKCSG